MKLHPVWIAAALVLPLCTAGFAPADEVRFAPSAGLKLKKEFASTGKQTLDSMRMSINGEEREIPEARGSFTSENTSAYEFVDEYVKVDGARVLELVRTFAELGDATTRTQSAGPAGEETTELAGSSELEGKSVRFTWDAEAEEYVKSWVGESGSDALLEDLQLDCDATGLLPTGSVSTGDTWEVPVDALRLFMEPGGDLQVLDETDDEASRAQQQQLRDALEGKAEAEYKGMVEEGGRKLARIHVTGKLSAAADYERDEENGSQQSVSVELEFTADLLWNAAAGHLESAESKVELVFEITTTRDLEGPNGESATFVQFVELKGSGEDTVRFSAAD